MVFAQIPGTPTCYGALCLARNSTHASSTPAYPKAEQITWATGKKGIEDVLLGFDSGVVAFRGQLRKSREQSRRAVVSANEANETEAAAGYLANSALREALFGNREEARKSVLEANRRSDS